MKIIIIFGLDLLLEEVVQQIIKLQQTDELKKKSV
jgi:hypothetical protein